MNYRIRWDFSKAQPKWNARLSRDFGEHNEGVLVTAIAPRLAIDAFNARRTMGEQYNPFYLECKMENK